jgi:hypothetical protein
MLQDRSSVSSIAERVGPDEFRTPEYRAVFAALLEKGEDASIEELTSSLDAESLDVFEEMLGEGKEALQDATRTIDDSISKLHMRMIHERLSEIDRLIPLAGEKEKDELLVEKQHLVKTASGKTRYKAFPNRG